MSNLVSIKRENTKKNHIINTAQIIHNIHVTIQSGCIEFSKEVYWPQEPGAHSMKGLTTIQEDQYS